MRSAMMPALGAFDSVHIFGDSILKGISFDEERGRYAILRGNCVSRLAECLPVPVVNHARMGLTAPKAEAEMRGGDLVPGGLALIEFGGNDCDMPWADIAANPDGQYAPQVPLDAFAASLARMARRVMGAGMRAALVVPTPMDAARYFDWVTRGLDKDAVLRYVGDVHHLYRWQECYACAVVDVAAELGCPALNLRRAFLEEMRLEPLLCADGIHPSAAGHRVMFGFLAGVLGAEMAGEIEEA